MELKELKRLYGEGAKSPFEKVVLTFCKPVMLYQGKRRGYETEVIHDARGLFFIDYDAFYMPMSNRSRGYSLPSLDLLMSIEFVTKDYGDEWSKIAKSMRKCNVNLDVAQVIEDHLAGKTTYIDAGFQNYWKRLDKPRKISFRDVVGSFSLADLVARMTTTKYGTSCHLSVQGQHRDRSVTLCTRKDDTLGYTAASEYSGYGNGDYYCMYSRTMGFYTCTD